MVDGENLHAVFGDAIDNSVIPFQKFPDVLATELGHYLTGTWKHAELFDGLAQPPDEGGSSSWSVSSDECSNLPQILPRLSSPEDPIWHLRARVRP